MREDSATMDQSDIRGLATAFHRSVAGLPRSRVGDHRVDAHVELSRVPLIVFAHRVADREWVGWCGWPPGGVSMSAAGQGAAGICRAMSQMKPASSRAIAVQVLL